MFGYRASAAFKTMRAPSLQPLLHILAEGDMAKHTLGFE